MNTQQIKVKDVVIGKGKPVVLIAGPCVIESAESAIEHARELKKITQKEKIPFIFKTSYDKANRSSISSFRGPGLEEGLEILGKIRKELDVPILTDVHSVDQVDEVAEAVDILQIPAFLCRQTDLVIKAASSGKAVNVKKGQFMSPKEMENVVKKIESTGNKNILLTERGTSFGYNMLVNDFRGVIIMSEMGYPVVYDATHSVQMPGGKGASSGGEARFVPVLSRAAVTCGVDALFVEVHKDPEKALSDGPNMIRMSDLSDFISGVKKVEKAVREI